MQVPFGNVIRGQDTATTGWFDSIVPGGQDYRRLPMQFSGQPVARGQNAYPSTLSSPLQANQGNPGTHSNNMFGEQVLDFGQNFDGPILNVAQTRLPTLDFDVYVDEARTGRFMFGMGVNSDLGVTGQVVIEERNFDFLRLPTSWNDIIQGGAFRGGGQNFRLEAMPGTQVQRYLASFTHPYIYLPGFVDPFSLNLSGFLFDRRYFDWTESRLGGRIGLGYRLTHDLSLAGSIRAESVDVNELRVVGLVPELDEVVGENELYSGRVTITHDTRDTPFAPTEGHLFEVSYEQVFGSFDYPRAEFDYRQYFLIRERPDGSGRHTLGYAFKAGFSGSQTPIFERFFAGGFSTMRGFDFRGASPVGAGNVTVGGDFRFLGSVEYIFPLTADDMMRGVVFCDYGTVEQDITINSDNYRVAPGAGLRISVPALGPAPLALDFAFPLAKAATDDTQVFSFFFGFGR
jgi:outer membrane protein insertion porin family